MKSDEFERIAEIFEAALRLPVEERQAYIEEVCEGDAGLREHLAALLDEHERAGGPLATNEAERSRMEAEPGSLETREELALPERIEGYRILREIGRGGMGVVVQAEQESLRRTVALKFIRDGLMSEQSQRRFQTESEVLAWLHHPGIAEIFEAGTAVVAGRAVPFFAMEYVDGQTLIEYADSQRPTIRERLELFVRICEAVEHAHQKGVIHRDLKPGNILVEPAGQPKILDFGIARITQSDLQRTTWQTEVGQVIGTLPYMSPEQIGGEVRDLDTRSDVYALGVVLYQLIAGRLPFDLAGRSIPEAIRIVTGRDAPLLGSVDERFRGDIEAIVARALERERERRYSSTAELAGDVMRHLRDEPVLARPQTTFYQMRKFARRHRLVVGLTGGIVLAIIVFGALATWQWTAAARERDVAVEAKNLADDRLGQAQLVMDFLRRMLESVDPRRDGHDVRVVEVLDRAAPLVDGSLEERPRVRATVHNTLGVAYYNLALYEKAARHLDRALEERRALERDNSTELIESLQSAALLLIRRNRLVEARSRLDEALSLALAGGEATQRAVAVTHEGLGRLHRAAGDLSQSEESFRESLAVGRRCGVGKAEMIPCVIQLADLLKFKGRFDEAEELLESALATVRRRWTQPHFDKVNTLVALGDIYYGRGNSKKANELSAEAVELSRELLTDEHPDLATILRTRAELLIELGEFDDAESLLDESLEICQKVFGEQHLETSVVLTALAYLAYSRRDIKTHETFTRRSLEIRKRLFGERHPTVAQNLQHLSMCAEWNHRPDEAIALLEKAIEILRESVSDANPELANCLHSYGVTLLRHKDPAAAVPYFEEALAMRGRIFGTEGPDFADTQYEVATALSRAEKPDFDKLASLYDNVIRIHTNVYGEESMELVFALTSRAVLCRRQGRFADGVAPARRAVLICEKHLEEDDWLRNAARGTVGTLLLELDQLKEAEKYLADSFPHILRQLGPAHRHTRGHFEALKRLYEKMERPEEIRRIEQLLDPEPESDESP